jgi:hypothetical protein
MLQRLHVLRGSQACVHPGLVANRPLAHELHVRVGLGDLALHILQGRPRPHEIVVDGGDLSLETAQLGKLGQGRLAVCNLVQPRVQRLQIQQTPLTARVGFQDVPPVLSIVLSPMVSPLLSLRRPPVAAPTTKSQGSVRSVQM